MRTLTRSLLLLSLLAPSALVAQIAPPAARPEALVLSPEPGERLAGNQVMVAVSFIDPGATLDNGSVRVQVGERDVTAEAELRGGILVWRPRQPLPTGPHRVVVTGRDRSGAEIDPASWTFNVTTMAEAAPAGLAAESGGNDVPGARIRGTVVLEGASQSVSGAGAELQRAEEFLPLMWLNAGGVISSGWRYSARVHLSGYESEFQQPVNRFRFDVRGPFLNLAVGDVNPIFQELILAGRRVRGVQGELILGPLRIAGVNGESRRAVQGALSPGDPTVISRFGTFGQTLIAVRPSIGSGEHFQLGLTAMQVRDDTTSLLKLRTSPFTAGGSTRSVNPAPKDNLVAGVDLTLRFGGGRVLLQGEVAASLLANDISSGPLTEVQLDSLLDAGGYSELGVDPSSFERFFIVNASLVPLDPRAKSSIAQQARASVRAGNHLLVGEWRSIGGSYYTLGQPSLQRDRAGIRLSDSFSALSDALVVSVGYETDEDNLDAVKLATTTTQGIFGNVSWQESPSGLGLSGAVRIGSRSNDQTRGQDGAMDESTTSLSGSASLPFGTFSGYRTRLSLNGSVINRDDPLNPTSGSKDLYVLGGVQGESESRESTGALLFGVNRSELTGLANVVTNLYRATANGRHRLAPQWVATFDGAYTKASSPEAAGAMGVGYNRMELLGGAEFEWEGHTTVGFTTGLINYADQRNASRNTRELLARLRVSRSF